MKPIKRDELLVKYQKPQGIPHYKPNPRLHISKNLILAIPKPLKGKEIALDFGCGPGINRPLLESSGYRYIGIDMREGATVVGDGHCLPFRDESFDFIISVAVIEHLSDPWQASRELNRVLKPGGYFLGTIAFLEPFHGNSFFHMSHLGIQQLLGSANFEIDRIWPGANVVETQIQKLFPLPICLRGIISLFGKIIWWLSQIYYLLRQRLKPLIRKKVPTPLIEHELAFASGIYFLARKICDC